MNTPAEIAKNYVGIGKGKVNTPPLKLFILGIMAGIFIGIGGIAYEMATATIGGALGKLVGACMFPAGLALVLIAGSELFTGNCLLVIPLLEGEVKFSGVLKNWVFVYLGNFVGSLLLAFLVAFGHSPSLLDKGLLDVVMSVAAGKVALSFGDAVFRGIVCNMMVCLAVWMSFAGKTVASKHQPCRQHTDSQQNHSQYCPEGYNRMHHPAYAVPPSLADQIGQGRIGTHRQSHNQIDKNSHQCHAASHCRQSLRARKPAYHRHIG